MPSLALQQQWSSALEHQSGPIFANLKAAKALKAQHKKQQKQSSTVSTADKFVVLPSTMAMSQQWASALVHESGPIFSDLKRTKAAKKEKMMQVKVTSPVDTAASKAHVAMPSAFAGAQSWASALVYESGPIFSDLKAAKAFKKQQKKEQQKQQLKSAADRKNFIAMPSAFAGPQSWATALAYESGPIFSDLKKSSSTQSSDLKITINTTPEAAKLPEPTVSVTLNRPASTTGIDFHSVNSAADSAYASDIGSTKEHVTRKTARHQLRPLAPAALPSLRI